MDRENDIRDFIPREYWSIDVKLDRIAPNAGSLSAHFYGKENGKIEPASQKEVDVILNRIQDAEFVVSGIRKAKKQKSPAPPFITSTLQQEASRKLNMPPRRTMTIAQQLYEGVEIEGQGLTGLISYMRTDSLRISDEAIFAARDYIKAKHGEKYCPKSFRIYKTKKGAQDAHEAIRPTYVNLEPDKIKSSLTPEQYKLYKLIWSRFIACQMENAVYDTISVDISAADYIFRATSAAISFKGYTAVYVEGNDDNGEKIAENSLPDLSEGEKLNIDDVAPQQHFTIPPARYTEASLIKAMEEKGVGRPSTYAPTISTILDREYVEKVNKNLQPTALGEVVNSLMVDKFKDIIDVEFTAKMEESLDLIETGAQDWKKTLEEFYQGFERDLTDAEKALEGERLKVPEEVTDVICEKCGKNMVVKTGRFGKFLACPGYPECKNTKAIVEETPGECPNCGGKILKKKSKNGYAYFGCEKFPDCTFMTWDVPQKERCEECGKTMYKRSGKGQKKIFCANPECSKYEPQPERVKKVSSKSAKSAGKRAKSKTAAKKKTTTKTKDGKINE